MKKISSDWTVYRTRFLIKAKQLTEPLTFVDLLGRDHVGKKGDYLVESSDGTRSIVRRAIFEDIYVSMGLADNPDPTKFQPPRREADSWLYPTGTAGTSVPCGKRAS